MLKNYLKITYRNLVRHSGYTAINVLGLAVGFATVILIFLWIMDEYSYDRFHRDKDRLYRVMQNSHYAYGPMVTYPTTPAPLAPAIKAEVPEIENAVRASWEEEVSLRYGKTSLLVTGLYAGPGLFEMFTFPIVLGDKAHPLPNEHAVAISKSIADKYFPDENPIGQLFKVADKYDMTVSAVFKDIPSNSSLQFDFIMPFQLDLKANPWKEQWGNYSTQTFVKLYAGSSVDKVNAQMEAILKKNCKDCIGMPVLHGFSDQRLYSEFENGKVSGGRIEYVRIFMLVALFILVIACVNFMNLATARAATRAREVGVRKIIGARRKNLVFQFMGEAMLVSFAASLLAVGLVEILLPLFNTLTEKAVFLDFTNPAFVSGLFGVTGFAGIISGAYPAFFLSSCKPASILKGKSGFSFRGGGLRKSLVVFQFSLSICLIVGSLVIYHQTTYILEKELGFDTKNIITFDLRDPMRQNLEAFKSEALRYPGIKGIAAGGEQPFNIGTTTTDPQWPGKIDGQKTPFKIIWTGNDFIPTMNMTVVEGRNFSANYKLDSTNYIVNEAAVKVMGLENPVGTPLTMWPGRGQIIGVVKDFHNQDFKTVIQPLIFICMPENTWKVYARIQGGEIADAIGHLEVLYDKFYPEYPFEYAFLDEEFHRQYQSEMTLEKLMVYFTAVAILISCLGLFGLGAFSAQQRTREIGVRKVLGASVCNIIVLLSKDFLKLVLIAIIIALPISWIVMQNWLEVYAYRISIKGAYLVLAGIIALLIAFFTVSYQSMKAAMANPVDSLKSE